MTKKEVDSALMSLQEVIQTTKSKLLNGSSSLEVHIETSDFFIFLIPILEHECSVLVTAHFF